LNDPKSNSTKEYEFRRRTSYPNIEEISEGNKENQRGIVH
jgi:hypothetical protein